MSIYMRIIKTEDVEWTGANNNCLDGEVTEYTGLTRIERPYKNSNGKRWEEVVHITHQDGTTERVEGHFLGSGQE